MIHGTPFSLSGRTALITGAGSGLGLAMAECMIASGARVIVADLDEGRAKGAAEALGDRASWSRFDVSRTDETGRWAADMIDRHQRIDILVNNAGNHCKKPVEEMSLSDFQAVMEVHVTGAFALTQALVPHMKQRGGGSVLFTASMASFMGIPGVSAYSAAKSALVGLVRSLAVELGPFGIRANGIAPGWIDTPMVRKAMEGDDERKNRILGRTPMKSFGTPADVGWAAVFLSSDAARFVNGHILVVDGGVLIGF